MSPIQQAAIDLFLPRKYEPVSPLSYEERLKLVYRVYSSLMRYPHIASAANKERFLQKSLVFHQFMAGDKTRKFNPETPLSEHDLRVTENVLAYGISAQGHYPSKETTAGSLFHDLVEDHGVRSWVLKNLFGETVNQFVAGVSLPDLGKEPSTERDNFKYLYQANKIASLDSGQILLKFWDGIDSLHSYARQYSLGMIHITDEFEKPTTANVTKVVSRRKLQIGIYRRHALCRKLQARLEEIHDDPVMNRDGFDCLKMARDFSLFFTKTALVYAAVTQVSLPSDLRRAVAALPKNELLKTQRFILGHSGTRLLRHYRQQHLSLA